MIGKPSFIPRSGPRLSQHEQRVEFVFQGREDEDIDACFLRRIEVVVGFQGKQRAIVGIHARAM